MFYTFQTNDFTTFLKDNYMKKFVCFWYIVQYTVKRMSFQFFWFATFNEY